MQCQKREAKGWSETGTVQAISKQHSRVIQYSMYEKTETEVKKKQTNKKPTTQDRNTNNTCLINQVGTLSVT